MLFTLLFGSKLFLLLLGETSVCYILQLSFEIEYDDRYNYPSKSSMMIDIPKEVRSAEWAVIR